MSLGIGAYAKLILSDEETVIYKYGCYNLNDEQFRNKDHIQDGLITVLRKCFIEPEIHKKLKKLPSGRKKEITKKILVDVDSSQYIADGWITIDNCSNCWWTTKDDNQMDMMALRLIFQAFHVYQIDGTIPKALSIHV